jgi:hypothetical protein
MKIPGAVGAACLQCALPLLLLTGVKGGGQPLGCVAIAMDVLCRLQCAMQYPDVPLFFFHSKVHLPADLQSDLRGLLVRHCRVYIKINTSC